jgi:hypothetical protein
MFTGLRPGQRRTVSLPAGQQQVLDRIETDLEGGEPRLRSMFAIFTRLTRDEEAPAIESLSPVGRPNWLTGRLRTVVTVPVIVILGLALLVFLAVTSSAAHGCRPAVGGHPTARVATCQSAQVPPNHS